MLQRTRARRINRDKHPLELRQSFRAQVVVARYRNSFFYFQLFAGTWARPTIRTKIREPMPDDLFNIKMQTVGYSHQPRKTVSQIKRDLLLLLFPNAF